VARSGCANCLLPADGKFSGSIWSPSEAAGQCRAAARNYDAAIDDLARHAGLVA
jgi:hypothetical protein